MANTTVRGAQAIHGQNPQVIVATSIRPTRSQLTTLVSSRNNHQESYLRISLLERTLLCTDWCATMLNVENKSLTHILAETLIDKAIELHNIGGVYGNQKPTEFMCLLLKLLQIQPEKEILVEYLQADEFKYVHTSSCSHIKNWSDLVLKDI